MIVPLSLHIADDDLTPLRLMRGEQDLREFLMARLLADYQAVIAKGRKALETQQMLAEGHIEAVFAREDA